MESKSVCSSGWSRESAVAKNAMTFTHRPAHRQTLSLEDGDVLTASHPVVHQVEDSDEPGEYHHRDEDHCGRDERCDEPTFVDGEGRSGFGLHVPARDDGDDAEREVPNRHQDDEADHEDHGDTHEHLQDQHDTRLLVVEVSIPLVPSTHSHCPSRYELRNLRGSWLRI